MKIPERWTSEPDDQLEVQAAEWLVLRDAGMQRTPAVRAVERALTDAYERRRKVRMLEQE